MAFETESEMRKVAEKTFRDAFDEPNASLYEEFEYGSGRADYVLARISDSYLSRRLDDLRIDTAIEDDRILQTFLLLHNRETISRDHYYNLGALDRNTKTRALEWLLTKGFATEVNDTTIRTTPNLRRHVTTAYSIELKLCKWKEALRQAFRGKGFSDYQYVVMDNDHIDRAIDNQHQFEKYGIGLMSIDEDGTYEIHLTPERNRPYSLINKWRLNERTLMEELQATPSTYAGAAGD